MLGTIIITLLLILIVAAVITSMVKDKRRGRHPSCGGNCGSCGHSCSAYTHVNAFLQNQKKNCDVR